VLRFLDLTRAFDDQPVVVDVDLHRITTNPGKSIAIA
jgi:hypothetical protein